MKKQTKVLCLFIALIMLFSLAACNENKSESTSSSTPQTEVQSTEDVTPYAPSGNKYDGEDFVILLSSKAGDMVNFFDFSEEDPTIIDTAIQKRNIAVEEEYDVKLSTLKEVGANNTASAKMSGAIAAGSLDYHLSFIEAYSVVPLAYQGDLYELNSINGIDLKKDWWDQNANRDLAVNGLMFFTTGDIDAWDDTQQFIMIFNTDNFTRHVTDYTLEEFYKLSEDGKWTYDKLFSIAKGYTNNIDGDEFMDEKDRWGLLTWDDTIYSSFVSCGAKIVSIDGAELSLSVISDEKAQECMRKYTEWTEQNAYNYSVRDNWSGSKAIKMFTNNQALFFLERLQVLKSFRDMDSDFGLVPVPKYTEEQSYNVFCSPYHMSFACTLNLEDDITMRGEVTESLAYHSKQHLTPAYREKTLEGQDARDDGSLKTLAITSENRLYDFGFYLQPGNIPEELIALYRKWDTDYASMYERVRGAAEQSVLDVEKAYKALASEWK